MRQTRTTSQRQANPFADRAVACVRANHSRGDAEIVCVTGPELGRRFRVGRGMFEVGRKPNVEILLRDRRVSRSHAFFKSDDDGISIADAHSRNGTFVNGARVRCFVRLEDGDLIQVGQCLLRFCGQPVRLSPVIRDRAIETEPRAALRRHQQTVCARRGKSDRATTPTRSLLLAAAAVAGFASVWFFWS